MTRAMCSLKLESLHLVFFYRSCIFPFLIKGGKDTPLFTFIMALVFCVVNGYLQAGFLLYHADYGTQWWTRSHIWAGESDFNITIRPQISIIEHNNQCK